MCVYICSILNSYIKPFYLSHIYLSIFSVTCANLLPLNSNRIENKHFLKCADSSQCCSNECLHYLDIHICIEKRAPITTTTAATTTITASPNGQCLLIGEKVKMLFSYIIALMWRCCMHTLLHCRCCNSM